MDRKLLYQLHNNLAGTAERGQGVAGSLPPRVGLPGSAQLTAVDVVVMTAVGEQLAREPAGPTAPAPQRTSHFSLLPHGGETGSLMRTAPRDTQQAERQAWSSRVA